MITAPRTVCARESVRLVYSGGVAVVALHLLRVLQSLCGLPGLGGCTVLYPPACYVRVRQSFVHTFQSHWQHQQAIWWI